MIEIGRIEVTNIRALGRAVVEPLPVGGVTALNGANGVGKCLPGWVRVHDADTGEALPIEQFVREQRKRMLGFSRGKIQPVEVTDWMSLGPKPTVLLRLRNGVEMEVASTHPILTDRGCIRAADLEPGDWVAEARSLPEAGPVRLSVDEAMLVGLLLGDGTLGSTGVQLTAGEDAVGELFAALVERIFPGLSAGKGKAKYEWYVRSACTFEERTQRIAALAARLDAAGVPLARYVHPSCVAAVRRGDSGFTWDALQRIEEEFGLDLHEDRCALWGVRALVEWTKDLGITGTRAKDKHLPRGCHLLPSEQVRALLAGLWLTDGWFTPATGEAAYGTDSRLLAQDVRLLLLRLGLTSTLQTQVRPKGTHYRVVLSKQSVRAFGDIPLVGPKAERRDETLARLADRVIGHGSVILGRGLATQPQPLAAQAKPPASAEGAVTSREVFRDFRGAPAIADAECSWTRVASVEPTGREADCYDVTVDTEEHLYLAETLIVHNSSLLTALVWCLYGVTPDGVPVSALRRQGSDGECRVVVTFRHDGQQVQVERGLKGARDATYVKIHVDGREQAFGKVRAAEAWIISRLGGLDAEGFLVAFVVRQKELDGLVKARPADRRRLIERLAGIDRMSAAVKAAREEETAVRRQLDLLPGSPEDLQRARAELDAAQRAAAAAWERQQQAAEQAARAERELTVAASAADAARTRAAAHRQAVDRLRDARHAAQLAAERAEQATREVARLTAAAEGGDPDALTAAQAAHRAALTAAQDNRVTQDRLARATEAATAAQQKATEAATAAQRATARAATAAAQAAQATAAATADPAELADQAQAAQAESDRLLDQVGALRGEHGRLAAAIAALERASDPTCPTCTRPLPDPSALVDTLRGSLDEVSRRGTALRSQQQRAAATAEDLRNRAAAAARARQAAAHSADQASDAEQAAAQATRLAEQAAAEAAQAAAAAAQVDRQVQQTGEALRRAETAAQAAALLPPARLAAQEATAADQTARAAVRDAQAEEAASRPASGEEERAGQRLAAAATAARDTAAAAQAAAGDFRVAQERVTQAERARDVEEDKSRARTAALADLEARTAIRVGLEEFRRERLARIAPELSEVATDFVARMTDGAYVSVELDEEFTPVVTDTQGQRRPVSWLSGGEESAVALALRVAIGELIAGQRGGLLWMDEALTAQDATRRPAMMAALRELPGRQIITINHVTEATDMVDRVLDVLPDEVAGSTVRPAGTFAGVDATAATPPVAAVA